MPWTCPFRAHHCRSLPVNGDYDADRVTNLAVYTASTGLWRVRNGSEVAFGEPSDKPVPADYNGDGSMDVAVYRPSTGRGYVRDQFIVAARRRG